MKKPDRHYIFQKYRLIFRYGYSAIRTHFAFRSLCFAGCWNSCSSVIMRTFPRPNFGGCRPHTPASFEIQAPNMTHSFQQRPPAIRAHFAFRSLCFTGCGNSCSSVIERAFPRPDFGGCCPHTPASFEIQAPNMTHSFQQWPPFSGYSLFNGSTPFDPVFTVFCIFGRHLNDPSAGGSFSLFTCLPSEIE